MSASSSEKFHFRHVLETSRDGLVAKPRSMLNKAILDRWQRSLFSRRRTPGKEPLLAGERVLKLRLNPITFSKFNLQSQTKPQEPLGTTKSL